MKKSVYAVSLVVFLALAIGLSGVIADTVGTGFEGFNGGSVDGQQGWTCGPSYDVAVVANPGISGFETQSLRISNKVTSGAFGDQTFSPSLSNDAGEATAEPSSYSGGTRQARFEAHFSLASALPTTEQTGLHMTVSPDRGDGARMSYLRFEDRSDGIHVFFDDVTGTTDPANFTEVDIATLDREVVHTIKFQIDFIAGPGNDVILIYIDGGLVRIGTSWENYYRFDHESNAAYPDPLNWTTRAVDSLLFRVSGAAAPDVTGFLIDNVNLYSGPSLYNFNGFFAPVNNSPVVNLAKAGSSIPVKFSLGGDKTLSIFATGYPKVQVVACDTGLPSDAIEDTANVGNSGLSYDPVTDQYTYVWKTDKAWKNKCSQLVLVLTDGSAHSANFSFK